MKIALVGFGALLLGGIAFSALLAARPVAIPTAARVAATPAALGPGDPKATYKKGQDVDIHWGSSWWAGSIVDVNGATYRAHYEGYGSGSDEWVTADRLRPRVAEDAAVAQIVDAAPEADAGDPNATYAIGDAVDIRWGSSWWKGRVKQKDGTRYRVGYDGYHSGWDEWVTAVRLRPQSAR
jgi:hypothetical protein